MKTQKINSVNEMINFLSLILKNIKEVKNESREISTMSSKLYNQIFGYRWWLGIVQTFVNEFNVLTAPQLIIISDILCKKITDNEHPEYFIFLVKKIIETKKLALLDAIRLNNFILKNSSSTDNLDSIYFIAKYIDINTCSLSLILEAVKLDVTRSLTKMAVETGNIPDNVVYQYLLDGSIFVHDSDEKLHYVLSKIKWDQFSPQEMFELASKRSMLLWYNEKEVFPTYKLTQEHWLELATEANSSLCEFVIKKSRLSGTQLLSVLLKKKSSKLINIVLMKNLSIKERIIFEKIFLRFKKIEDENMEKSRRYNYYGNRDIH